MKSWLRIALPAAGLVLAVGTALASRGDAPDSASPAAPARGGQRIVAEGRLATYPGAEIVVSTEVAGTLVALPVVEKQSVRRGQLIAELLGGAVPHLDPAPYSLRRF